MSSSICNFERSTEVDCTPLCIIQLADGTWGLHKTCRVRLDMVCECVFNMVKRYILTRLMSQREAQRESCGALEEHSNLFSTSSPISLITCPVMFRSVMLLSNCGRLLDTFRPGNLSPVLVMLCLIPITSPRHQRAPETYSIVRGIWLDLVSLLDMGINMYIPPGLNAAGRTFLLQAELREPSTATLR